MTDPDLSTATQAAQATQGAQAPAPASAKSARSRSSAVYAELRRRLLLGEYPLIERMAEVRLAEQFGASRTPVREALLRLESEGLVHRRPEGGFYPRSPNLAEIRDLYELRRIIELASLTRPRDHGAEHDRESLLTLRREWASLAKSPPRPDPDFVYLDERFHTDLVRAAGNIAVAEHLQLVSERIRVVRMQNFIHVIRIEITIRQHLEILDAVLAGEHENAVSLLAAHLDEALVQASERAALAITRMMTAGAVLNA